GLRDLGLPSPPKVHLVELNPTGEKTLWFVHGLGSNLKFWRYQLNTFAAQGYRVIAMDMIGYGKSDKPARFPYSIPSMAFALKEAMALMGVIKPIVIGHSMGGHTALALAIEDSALIDTMILVSPAGFEEFSAKDKLWFKRIFSSQLIKYAPESGVRNSIQYNNFYQWRDDLEWLVEERVRATGTPGFDNYAYANVKSIHGLLDTEYTRKNLSRIDVPTLIVFGHMDRLIPNRFMHGGHTEDVMRFGYEGISGSTLVGLPKCGHTAQADCPDGVNNAINRFLSER
ncbi:MAG: alpha/beta hydrolase, partial [Myxococcota bacterium]